MVESVWRLVYLNTWNRLDHFQKARQMRTPNSSQKNFISGPFFVSSFFLSLEFCYICYFCDICHGFFELARKIFVTFAIFAIFTDIMGPFLASFFSKS